VSAEYTTLADGGGHDRSIEEDVERDLATIKEMCELLVVGWYEDVEYKVPVAYHVGGCKWRSRSITGSCDCPVENESRKRALRRPGLIQQLKAYREHRDTDREPKAERAAPRVKKIKNNPELDGFLTLDEIACDATSLVDRVWSEAGRDRGWAVIGSETLIANLPVRTADLKSRPDLIRIVRKSAVRWVDISRKALRLVVSDSIFGSSVCGNCGGGLTVPWDNAGDVRCIGSPDVPACGESYPMSEWIRLYEEGKARK
jgi:hypothetical protein